MVDDAPYDIRDRPRVALWDDDPGPAAEQLRCVGKGRGDHRTAAGDRVNEDTGCDLVVRVIGQHDEIRRPNHPRERRQPAIGVVELH